MKSYLKLCEKFETTSNIYKAMSILGWDNSVMMPEGSAEDRARQQATLGGIAHQIITSPEVKDMLDQAEKNEAKDLDEWQKANLRLMKNEWIHNNAVPENLLKEFTMASSECEMRWRSAKADNDFKTFAFFLKKVLKLSREMADLKASALGLSRYDALLDQYDEGRRSADIDKIFADLKIFLPGFIEQVRTKQSKQKQPIKPSGHYPVETQRQISLELMKLIGFNFDKGRLDVSAHPFSGGTPDDVRITTRYNEADYTDSLMSIFHETGHAMYTFGQPEKYRSQPVGNSLGMSIHESQSLLLEMQVCRSHEFLGFLEQYTKKYFGDSYENSAENLYAYYNHVEPSLIRVGADEVTYPLHVILRYDIEKKLVEGEMEVDDIPAEWNKKMKEYLGITPPNDREGCMQDIHWSDGSFGYFPTYTLGAMTAAQFYAQAKKDHPGIVSEISEGKFSTLMHWLREKIHSQGCLHTADELTKNITGQPLNAEIFKSYLKNKYLG
jgi:carboxypeptidase Taq